MSETNPVEEKIISTAKGMFMRYGIKSITMDDVARELAISKKTLYQYCTDKNDLVQKVFTRHIEQVSKECSVACIDVSNPIEQLLKLSVMRAEDLNNMHPALLYDLKKYYPEQWQELDKYKNEFIFGMIWKNLEQGKATGLYREDINHEIVARFYVYLVDTVLDVDGLMRKKYDGKILHHEMVTYHLRAICTKKGLDYLNKKIKDSTI
ncbi:MAG TPA: TetR/AcrR family transcriptional regulator [Bacteroidia bacterium]|nr:TetR/AcrR family transcriptional regulator [Bacteroidia bacterium]